jgi:beta-galactosidase
MLIQANWRQGRRALAACVALCMCGTAAAQEKFSPPATAHAVYNFNPGWKFIKQEVAGAEAESFNDAAWADVSTPHTFNDVDSFDEYISRSGEGTLYMGPVQYRKHFKLPATAAGNRVVLEFEGMRQAAKFWVNGKQVGMYEDGVTAYGLDITDAVHFGGQENVLAVWLTNATTYQEEATKTAFQWASKDFNPNYGGINRNVRLHILPPVHQTLPLLNGLNTTGVYVYATDFDIAGKKATINIEAQVKNMSAAQASVTLSAVVVDRAGNVRARLAGETYDMVNGEGSVLKAAGALADARWWDPADPYLYDVYSVISVEGRTVDVQKITTGFRKTEFKGGAGTGGIYINGKFTYLKGYAQRTTNEWAAVGGAYPDWMHDFDTKLMTDGNANYMRWMHIAPRAQEVTACDKYGVVQVCPAGDKEANPTNPVQWAQRMDVMRKTIIYYRNSPSILMWEAGNSGITAVRMQEMVDLRKQLDPSGGRAMGCRTLQTQQDQSLPVPEGDNLANTRIAEWFGVMIAQDTRADRRDNPRALFRAYSEERRDLAPFIETEDFRDESLRMFWDDYSPPHFGFKKGPQDTYNWNSETFSLAAARRYNDYWSNRISNTESDKARWSAYASIIWADSNQHGRQPNSEVCRTSGKVDAVRIPKQAYFVYRVMQNEQPDLHVIGHWNYPADTTKTMYVAANHVDAVELLVNGTSKGKKTQPTDGFIYPFPNVAWAAGSVKAVGYQGTKVVAEHELKTVGEAKAIKLTPHTGPKGLQADGSDVVFYDVEVVDAAGNRCPLDEGRVDFEMTGPGIWRGGVNEHLPKSTNNTYLNTECGINRVFVRSTMTAGKITLTAKREGLAPATVTVDALPIEVKDGLAVAMPQGMAGGAK